MTSKELKSIVLAVVITALITFTISYVIFKYIPENNENSKINAYKKELYSSTLCQYGCPLTLQDIQNKTQYFPDQTCIQECTKNFKELEASGEAISNEQMKNDNLIQDMADVVNNCKKDAVDVTAQTLDNTLFFTCSAEKLAGLKSKYGYLN